MQLKLLRTIGTIGLEKSTSKSWPTHNSIGRNQKAWARWRVTCQPRPSACPGVRGLGLSCQEEVSRSICCTHLCLWQDGFLFILCLGFPLCSRVHVSKPADVGQCTPQPLVLEQHKALARGPIILVSLEPRSTRPSCALLAMSPHRASRALLGPGTLLVHLRDGAPLPISGQQPGPSVPRQVCTPPLPHHFRTVTLWGSEM